MPYFFIKYYIEHYFSFCHQLHTTLFYTYDQHVTQVQLVFQVFIVLHTWEGHGKVLHNNVSIPGPTYYLVLYSRLLRPTLPSAEVAPPKLSVRDMTMLMDTHVVKVTSVTAALLCTLTSCSWPLPC